MAKENRPQRWKRSLIEWGIIVLATAFIYMMGWHTQIIGPAQRAMLWTGLFDADTSQIETTDGPMLTDSDFRFAMETTGGKTVSLSDFHGDVVFINVWASWCPPCVAEMPTIETLYESVNSNANIRFILLSMDQKKQKAIDFMEGKKLSMPYYFPASALPNPNYAAPIYPRPTLSPNRDRSSIKKKALPTTVRLISHSGCRSWPRSNREVSLKKESTFEVDSSYSITSDALQIYTADRSLQISAPSLLLREESDTGLYTRKRAGVSKR